MHRYRRTHPRVCRAYALATVVTVCAAAPAWSAPPLNFRNELVLSGLSQPTSVLALPNGRVLAAEKTGGIVIADPSTVPAVLAVYMTITDIDVQGEHGLIDLAVDPDFDSNGYVYAYYARASTARYRIARFTNVGFTGSLASETVIWEDTEAFTGRCCHHGGAISFGPDGKLYLTTGDEFDDFSPQNLASTQGKVLRMNPDGSVPVDNPFVDGPGGNDDHVWAYGLRNGFRARWDLASLRFFIADVGGNDHSVAWEEINFGVAGANYGWPACEGFCSNPAYADPAFGYPHLEQSASITGGVVYRGGSFPLPYRDAYFYGDYVRGWIRYLTFDVAGNVQGSVEFDDAAGGVTDIREGLDGALYYTNIFTGELRRYVYDPGAPLAHDDRAYVAPANSVIIDVVANDAGTIDPTTVAEASAPSAGSIDINPVTGQITYTHDGSALIEDAFSYTVDDNEGDPSNVAQVSVRVLTGDCTLITDGLALHLEADTDVTTTGTVVASWLDQSNFGNDLISTSGAPQFIAAAVNNQPAIAFNGVTDAMGRSGLDGLPVGSADRTVFLVLRYNSTGWGGFNYGAPQPNAAFGLAVSPDGHLAVRGQLAPTEFISPETGAGVGFLVQSVVVAGGLVNHYRNGDLIDTRVHAFSTLAERIRLGSSIDDSSHAAMDVAAVLAYNRALTDDERRTVQDYLQIKYFVDACDNLTPHALDDTAVVAPADTVEIEVSANDADVDGAIDTATVIILDPPLHATALSIHPTTGVVSYTHDGTATTLDSFTYLVSDNAGADSNRATVRIIVRDEDCNSNGIPDDVELSADCTENEPVDCNFDGVFDTCDADCDASGASDVCELMAGAVVDCVGTSGFVGDYQTGKALHSAFCAGCHNVGGVGGLGGAPNHRNRSRYEYQRKLSACQSVVGHYGGTNNLTIDDFAHIERFLTDYAAPDATYGGDGVPDHCQILNDCDTDGMADACAVTAGLVPDCNTNGVPDGCDLAGGGSSDCNTNGIPDECDRLLFIDDFDEYANGQDPDGWFDSEPENSLVLNEDLFHTFDVAGEIVFGTLTSLPNIHSHYVAGASPDWSDSEFTGRMLMTADGSGIGVTFWSDYPNSDAYYRLRRGDFVGGLPFHINPHGTTISGGDLNSEVEPAANVWYRFRIQITDTGTRTQIRANVWPDGANEPAGWQIDCYDASPTRRTHGTVGVWAFANGQKYWDDFAVTRSIADGPCDDRDPCTVNDACIDGVCGGEFQDCDSDGACDALDNCPTVANPAQLDADQNGYGDACDAVFDADRDGDVDAFDLAAMMACFDGPVFAVAPDCAGVFDVDADQDVDLADFAAAQRAFTGSLASPCD